MSPSSPPSSRPLRSATPLPTPLVTTDWLAANLERPDLRLIDASYMLPVWQRDAEAEYRDRHRIRPGISGLAQVKLGYAEGVEATREKTRLDIEYIENASFKLDAKLLCLTALTILKGHGR